MYTLLKAFCCSSVYCVKQAWRRNVCPWLFVIIAEAIDPTSIHSIIYLLFYFLMWSKIMSSGEHKCPICVLYSIRVKLFGIETAKKICHIIKSDNILHVGV